MSNNTQKRVLAHVGEHSEGQNPNLRINGSVHNNGAGDNVQDHATKLVQTLWRGGVVGNVWSLDGNNSQWLYANGTVDLGRFMGQGNAYIGVHPLTQIPPTKANGEPAKPKYVRSQIPYIAAINCLFADFDAKDFGSKEAAWDHVQSLPIQPSAIVDSGGGFHAYWVLNQTFRIQTEEDLNWAERLQAAWVDLVGSDQGAKDLARVLRLPGTLNMKYGTGVPVQVVMFDESRTYAIEDLEAAAMPFMPQEKPSERESSPIGGILDPDIKHGSYDLFEVAAVVGQLTPEQAGDYQTWLEVGMATKLILGEPGWALFDAFSQKTQDGNYDPEANRKQWDRWSSEPDPGKKMVGMTRLRELAEESHGESQQVQGGPSFVLLSRDDLTQRKPKEYYIKGVVPKGEDMALVGSAGSGKTVVAADMAGSLVTRKPFAYKHIVPEPVNVLYASGEGNSGMADRILATAEKFDFTPEDWGRLRFIEGVPQLFQDGPKGVVQFIQDVKASGFEPAVIFIDTMRRAMIGGNENSAADTQIVFANLEKIRAAFPESTVVVLHHNNKSGEFSGSTNIWGSLDTMLEVEKTQVRGEYGEIRELSSYKQKDGGNFAPLHFAIVSQTIPGRKDQFGEDANGAVAVWVEGDIAKAKGKGRLSQARQAIVDFLKQNPGTAYTTGEIHVGAKRECALASTSELVAKMIREGDIEGYQGDGDNWFAYVPTEEEEN